MGVDIDGRDMFSFTLKNKRASTNFIQNLLPTHFRNNQNISLQRRNSSDSSEGDESLMEDMNHHSTVDFYTKQ